ncbi:MAG: preprotein translocase subunit SecG [Alphaproteobacteria bacterium]|nr:preprotein translocase subunit SecG [Alphaproteobacteria bacterium]
MFFTVFIVVQIILTLSLVGLILIQRNDSDGLGSMGGGGGGGNAFMTGRGAANLMTRTTAIIATLFMLNSLGLAIMAANMNSRPSLAEKIEDSNAETISVPIADDVNANVPATDPKPLSPEMPVITTEEPSGDPVSATTSEYDAEMDAEESMDMDADVEMIEETEAPEANETVPTP